HARDPRPAAAPGGPVHVGPPGPGGARVTRYSAPALQLLVPCALVAVVGLGANNASPENQIYWLNALVSVAIVGALYVFVGTSGVLSFGHISFVAVGAFAAGVLTVPLEQKQGALATVYPLLRDHTVGNLVSLLLAAAVGGLFALLLGLPLMRLSGL